MQKFMQMKFALDLRDHKFHMRHVGLVLNAAVAINAAKQQHPFMSTENVFGKLQQLLFDGAAALIAAAESVVMQYMAKINGSENLFCRMRVQCEFSRWEFYIRFRCCQVQVNLRFFCFLHHIFRVYKVLTRLRRLENEDFTCLPAHPVCRVCCVCPL